MDYTAITEWITKGGLKDWVPFIQILSPFMAAWMVLIQINRNHRNNIILQIQKVKDDLQSKLYTEISEKLEDANNAIHEATAYIDKIGFSLTSQHAAIQGGFQPSIPSERVPKVIELQYAAAGGITKLIGVIEKYEIVQPELKIFQKALNVCSHHMTETFAPFFQEALHILPVTIEQQVNGKLEQIHIPKPVPTKERLDKFMHLGFLYQEALRDFFGLSYDFRVEIQNLLLGDIFGRKVLPRQPLNPNIKVVRTDPHNIKKLDKHYEENTAWGKHKAEIEKNVKDSFNHQSAVS